MHAVEIKQEHSKLFLEISKELENLENDTYGSEVEEIGIIPIIVKINKYPKTRKLTYSPFCFDKSF
ncbi:hypothetical protein CN556_30900 [Bacillus wiedmannii]|uniref:Imm44 family immunity protein n=1 Tax=Bacillus wiedmannii TaxID=1890302 RepID=UPI000BF1C2BF|nr:Imm44 family immunity protein [Bacillus wiedmannii]PEI31142.1 hypothetical protein CN644_30270 [Bacillus wiedmannii]PEM00963.1 hypothetical protein CN604_09380 [Bacillus wiedmannii]PEN43055.1 hypothetical protein CN630_27985 [Bacillus wiedmannii]PEN86796.1 hypothetical protein CN556_30900 [Bacillus wiedmannii]PFY98613.1 hypothetical protein COL75_24510 [Bacillus wiedmannii]